MAARRSIRAACLALGALFAGGIAGLVSSGAPALAATPVHLASFPVDGTCSYEDSWQAGRGFSSTGQALYHEGVDIIAAVGVPVRAVVDGTVRLNTSNRGGIQLYLTAADSSYFFHAHLSRYAEGLVSGQAVKAGAVIAYVGQTGDAQGSVSHLHLEVHPAWNNRNPINPYPVVRELTGCGRAGTGPLDSLPDSVTSTISGTTSAVVSTSPTDTGTKPSNGFDGLSAIQPIRIADSRGAFSLTRFTPGTINYLTIAGHGGVPANASAVLVNMTVTNTPEAGWLRAWPCGQAIPDTSNLNYTAGQTVANGALLALGERGRLCFQATTEVDVIVDVTGWQGAGGSLGFASNGPERLFDSRTTGAAVGATTIVRIAIPGKTPRAATLNVTAVQPAGEGHITLWPCDQAHPVTSSLNFSAGEVIANSVTVGVSAKGEVCLDSSVRTDVVIDLAGSWAQGSGARPLPIAPARLFDTRGTDPQPGVVHRVVIAGKAGVPSNANAAQVNITVTGAHGAGFVTAWPCGREQPNVSNLNYKDGGTIANSAMVPLGGGQLCVAASSAADLIIDITGYLR